MKNNRTVRLMTFLLTMLLAVSALSSCGSGENDTKTSVTESALSKGADTSETEDTLSAKSNMSVKEDVTATESDISMMEDAENAETTLEEMQIHFIDVGQGDSSLVVVGNHAMLIDCGDNTVGTLLQNYLNKQGVTSLDYLILTHPDSDHIGAAPVIITKFDIDKVFMSDFEKDNKTYRSVIEALDNKRVSYSTPEVGSIYELGEASFQILAPNKNYEDPNNASVALLVTYGENRFLFTGDAEEDAESDIVDSGIDISADVYQAGHHGSNSSTTEKLLKAVNPTYAVISCAEGNSYGHPRAEVMNRLRAAGVKVFRTDEQGTLVVTSDGKNIMWNSAPSETWQAGEPTGSSASGRAATQKDSQTSSGSSQGAADSQTSPESSAATVDSQASGGSNLESADNTQPTDQNTVPSGVYYIGNKNNGKLHISTCRTLPKPKNQDIFATREEAEAAGYTDDCGNCMK